MSPLVAAVCGRDLVPRHATLLPFVDKQGQIIDQGLAILFRAPSSYTGEDVLELQAHGGALLLQLLLARCLEAGESMGLRLAEPGEFTERAFLNDKLDLAQAEAVADLIDASTEAAVRSAARSLSGAFSHAVESLLSGLVSLRTLVEATLDFPDEEIDFLRQADALGRLTALSEAVSRLCDRAGQGALLREGIRVVLAGQPNVGKSSLLNALAGAELAIVTPIAGTTRDKISQTIQIQGVPLHVIDTAGLRADDERADEVERIGIERSWQAVADADAVIFLHDLTRRGQPDYETAEAAIAQRLTAVSAARVLQVYNKCDAAAHRDVEGVVLSARTGIGLELLRQALLQKAGWHAAPEGVFMARTRHLSALRRCGEHLGHARAHAAQGAAALELVAEELRLAHQVLGEITGQTTPDDLLGSIFRNFCIGK